MNGTTKNCKNEKTCTEKTVDDLSGDQMELDIDAWRQLVLRMRCILPGNLVIEMVFQHLDHCVFSTSWLLIYCMCLASVLCHSFDWLRTGDLCEYFLWSSSSRGASFYNMSTAFALDMYCVCAVDVSVFFLHDCRVCVKYVLHSIFESVLCPGSFCYTTFLSVLHKCASCVQREVCWHTGWFLQGSYMCVSFIIGVFMPLMRCCQMKLACVQHSSAAYVHCICVSCELRTQWAGMICFCYEPGALVLYQSAACMLRA